MVDRYIEFEVHLTETGWVRGNVKDRSGSIVTAPRPSDCLLSFRVRKYPSTSQLEPLLVVKSWENSELSTEFINLIQHKFGPVPHNEFEKNF